MTPDAVVDGYAKGLLQVLEAEGDVEHLEAELFQVGKLLESNHELKQALSDPGVDAGERAKVLGNLLAATASPKAIAVVNFVIAQGRARQLPQIITRLAELVAEGRASVVAEVRSAIELDDTRKAELATALSKATGKKVAVKVVVDPSVIGGIVAKVGDTVIDGSIRRRLEQLKAQVR